MRQECPCARAVAAQSITFFRFFGPTALVAISPFSACDAISWPSYVQKSRMSCAKPGPKARKDGTHSVCALKTPSTCASGAKFREKATLMYKTNGV